MLTPSEYYTPFEDEFLSIIQSIEHGILNIENKERSISEKIEPSEVNDLDFKFKSARNCLNKLKDEVSILSKNSIEYQSYRRYNNVYNELNNRFKRIREEVVYEKNNVPANTEYIGDGFNGVSGVSTEDLITRNNDNIMMSSKLAHETHDIGVYSLNTLKIQRDNITRSKYGLDDINRSVIEGRKLASELYRQKILERLSLYIIIIILLLANIYVFIKKYI